MVVIFYHRIHNVTSQSLIHQVSVSDAEVEYVKKIIRLGLNPLFIRSQIQMYKPSSTSHQFTSSQSLIHQVSDSDIEKKLQG